MNTEAVADALQLAWDAYVADTGCYPDCFTASKDVTLTADFGRAPFARLVAENLAAGPPPCPEGVVVLDGKRWRLRNEITAGESMGETAFRHDMFSLTPEED